MGIKNIFFIQLLLNLLLIINALKFEDIIKNYNIKNKAFKKLNLEDKSHLNNNDEDLIDISNYAKIDPEDEHYFYVPIFGSSDIHGHYYPEMIEVGDVSYSKGGLDYLGTYVDIIRDEFKNRFLYLDAGDMFQGGTESSLTNGEIILDYFNLIGLNATTIGNHEYDESRDSIQGKVERAKFPFLSTNVYDVSMESKKIFGKNHFSSKVFNFTDNKTGKEIKIGVIGLSMRMIDNQIYGKGYEKIIFLDYKDELVAEANELRKRDRVNAVVLLSHIGIGCGKGNNVTLNMYKPTDEQESCNEDSDLYNLINSIEEGTIDAVVTGHSHREVHHWIKNIPIISPINNGIYANIIYLAFDKNNNYKIARDQNRIEGPLPICQKAFTKNHKCEFLKLSEMKEYLPLVEYKFHGKKIEKNSKLQPIHTKYDEKYKEYNTSICTLTGVEDTLTVEKNGSFYLGNFITDFYKFITGADISIASYGCLRAFWYPGKIRKYNIKDLLPYNNLLCSFKMKGYEVKKMMKIIQTGRKKYYLTSGLKQLMFKNKFGEYKLGDIKLYDGYKQYEIIPDNDYLISANNFLIVDGGDDFNKVLSWYKPKELSCEYGEESIIIEKYLKEIQNIDVKKYVNNDYPRIKFMD